MSLDLHHHQPTIFSMTSPPPPSSSSPSMAVSSRPLQVSSNAPDSTPSSPPPRVARFDVADTHTHGLELPWITRDLNHTNSSAALTTAATVPSSSPSGVSNLNHRVSELNLSAHPSRHAHARKNQSKTACFVHSLLQNGRARSPSRSGSTDDLTRGSMLEVIGKGAERRDRWNRGMTKKELSDMALGVRELSKRLGIPIVQTNFRRGTYETSCQDYYYHYKET